MGILARLFGGVPKTERGGIRLEERDPWEVAPTRDVERFLQALPLLAPEGAIAYFEGTGESHVAKYLREVSVSPAVHVAVGTIWPRPDCYHVPLTITSMEALAVFLTKRPAGYFCSHCNVYRDNSVLLQWHTRSPMIRCTSLKRFQPTGSPPSRGRWVRRMVRRRLANTPLQPTSGAGTLG